MNAVKHAEISVKRWGGKIEDYLPIHDFMDCTKELCPDNRHRILHTMWGVKSVIIPIFGHSISISEKKKVNVKDLCEKDHILPDYRNRFIPTLADFCAAIDEKKLPSDYRKRINDFHKSYTKYPEIARLLMSPLAQTGQVKSLLFTHNSWFINSILPLIFPDFQASIEDFALSPTDLFCAMNFEMWMDNGADFPKSTAEQLRFNN